MSWDLLLVTEGDVKVRLYLVTAVQILNVHVESGLKREQSFRELPSRFQRNAEVRQGGLLQISPTSWKGEDPVSVLRPARLAEETWKRDEEKSTLQMQNVWSLKSVRELGVPFLACSAASRQKRPAESGSTLDASWTSGSPMSSLRIAITSSLAVGFTVDGPVQHDGVLTRLKPTTAQSVWSKI